MAMTPPGWLLSLVSALGGALAALAALRNAGIARRLGILQGQQARAQTGQLEAQTVDMLYARISRLQLDADAQRARLDGVQVEVAELRRYTANVRRSAARIGVSLSTRGVLSVAPGAPILIVDDDADILALLAGYLEEEGYAVEAAGPPA